MAKNEAYSNFFQKVRIVVDKIAPCKNKKVKANTQKMEKSWKTLGTYLSKNL